MKAKTEPQVSSFPWEPQSHQKLGDHSHLNLEIILSTVEILKRGPKCFGTSPIEVESMFPPLNLGSVFA